MKNFLWLFYSKDLESSYAQYHHYTGFLPSPEFCHE